MSSETIAPSSTRAALLEAGRDELLSRSSFSMGSVAKRAGVSRQAVYLHFADRYALLDAIVNDALAASGTLRSMQRVAQAPSSDDALGRLVEVLVAVTADHGALDKAVRGVLASDAALADRWASRGGRRAAIRAVVDRLAADGHLRPDVSAPVCEAALRAFTATDFLLGLLDAQPPEAVADLVLRAIRAAVLGC